MLLALVLVAPLGACAPPGVVRATRPVLPEPLLAQPYDRSDRVEVTVSADGCRLDAPTSSDTPASTGSRARDGLDLVGDPDFDAGDLPADIRCWYEALWEVLLEPSRAAYFTSRALQDDLYTYSREMNTHITALLTALRVTGDLAFLDEADRLTQHMRSVLDDTWKRGAALESGSVDGYLNWIWDRDTSREHRGRDLHEIDEMRTHSLLANVAYAFKVNAEVGSPNGVDYAERAEFWTSYLVDHFEAKWRERHDVPWPEFPFIVRPHMHETTEFIRYHHYMYLLTGREPYRDEAERMAGIVLDNFVEVPTGSGPAFVTPRSVLSLGGSVRYLLPSTYVRYLYNSAVDLHLEGVGGFASDAVVERLARSLTEFIIDDGWNDFARDMGGGVDRGGVPASSASEWSRFNADRFNASSYALLIAWDDSGEVASVSKQVFAHFNVRQRDVFIPVALMLDAALN